MNKLFFRKNFKYFVIFLIIFLADRISKIYILSVLENTGEVDIYINSYINLILVWNTGIGFGLLSFDKSVLYDAITIAIIFINLIILFLITKSDQIRSYLFLIILGGSVGNLYDRIYYSAVPDFIDINFKGYHWFIFNVADIFISIGIICLIFVELMNYKKTDEN
tara:strand:- start:895 stop:1389 length:495 start_codon:yes stop_codon:yes gene_type:complete